MKTTDERLRAAARDAMDIFPPGGDPPPLRLPDLTSGYSRAGVRVACRAAMSRIGRARAWLTPVAAATAVALVIAGVVVLHQSANGSVSAKLTKQRAQARSMRSQQRQRQGRLRAHVPHGRKQPGFCVHI